MSVLERRASFGRRASLASAAGEGGRAPLDMRQTYLRLPPKELSLGVDGLTVARRLHGVSFKECLAGTGSGALRLKIAVIGDRVGKSSFAKTCAGGSGGSGAAARSSSTANTIGVDSWVFERERGRGGSAPPCKVTLWDMASAAQYAGVRTEFYKDSTAVLLCFSPSSKSSFASLPTWVEEARQHGGDAKLTVVSLVQSPYAERFVSRRDAEQYAASLSCACVEVNTTSGEGISDLIEAVVQQHVLRR